MASLYLYIEDGRRVDFHKVRRDIMTADGECRDVKMFAVNWWVKTAGKKKLIEGKCDWHASR